MWAIGYTGVSHQASKFRLSDTQARNYWEVKLLSNGHRLRRVKRENYTEILHQTAWQLGINIRDLYQRLTIDCIKDYNWLHQGRATNCTKDLQPTAQRACNQLYQRFATNCTEGLQLTAPKTYNWLHQGLAIDCTEDLQPTALRAYNRLHWGLATDCTEDLQSTAPRTCNQLHQRLIIDCIKGLQLTAPVLTNPTVLVEWLYQWINRTNGVTVLVDWPSRSVERLPWWSDGLSKNYSGRASGITEIKLPESACLVNRPP